MAQIADIFKISSFAFIILFVLLYFINPSFVQKDKDSNGQCTECAPSIVKVFGLNIVIIIIFSILYSLSSETVRQHINRVFSAIIGIFNIRT